MNFRNFSSHPIKVSEVGFGAWQLGYLERWKTATQKDAVNLVQLAVHEGCNFFDTAPNYGLGHSEEILGKALKKHRHNVVITSKMGHHDDDTQDFNSISKLRKSVENSLRRLKTDYLDGILMHNPPAECIASDSPQLDLLRQLKKEGKILHYGASVDWGKELQELLMVQDITIAEVMFNVFHQDPRNVFDQAKEKNLGLIIKVPLDSGWLTGKYSKDSHFGDIRKRWTTEILQKRTEYLEKVRFIEETQGSLVHGALQYILSYQAVSTVIPGCKSEKQLLNNLEASNKKMSPDIVKKLEDIYEDFWAEDILPW